MSQDDGDLKRGKGKGKTGIFLLMLVVAIYLTAFFLKE